jgi:hypothetical protein
LTLFLRKLYRTTAAPAKIAAKIYPEGNECPQRYNTEMKNAAAYRINNANLRTELIPEGNVSLVLRICPPAFRLPWKNPTK